MHVRDKLFLTHPPNSCVTVVPVHIQSGTNHSTWIMVWQFQKNSDLNLVDFYFWTHENLVYLYHRSWKWKWDLWQVDLMQFNGRNLKFPLHRIFDLLLTEIVTWTQRSQIVQIIQVLPVNLTISFSKVLDPPSTILFLLVSVPVQIMTINSLTPCTFI